MQRMVSAAGSQVNPITRGIVAFFYDPGPFEETLGRCSDRRLWRGSLGLVACLSADVPVDERADQRLAKVSLRASVVTCFQPQFFDELRDGDQLHVAGGWWVNGDIRDGLVAKQELDEVGGEEFDCVPALVLVRRGAQSADREVYSLLPGREHGQQGPVLDAEEAYRDGAGVRALGVVRDEDEPGNRRRVHTHFFPGGYSSWIFSSRAFSRSCS